MSSAYTIGMTQGYNTSNPFYRIIEGIQTCEPLLDSNGYVIHDGKKFMAFKSLRGKDLVVPRGNFIDFGHFIEKASKDEIGAYFEGICEVISDDKPRIVINNGSKSHQEVFHLHAHIYEKAEDASDDPVFKPATFQKKDSFVFSSLEGKDFYQALFAPSDKKYDSFESFIKESSKEKIVSFFKQINLFRESQQQSKDHYKIVIDNSKKPFRVLVSNGNHAEVESNLFEAAKKLEDFWKTTPPPPYSPPISTPTTPPTFTPSTSANSTSPPSASVWLENKDIKKSEISLSASEAIKENSSGQIELTLRKGSEESKVQIILEEDKERWAIESGNIILNEDQFKIDIMSYYFAGKTGTVVENAKAKYKIKEETTKLPETTITLISVKALMIAEKIAAEKLKNRV
jgi:hypothetical protein